MIRLAAVLALLPVASEAACRQALALGLDMSGSVDEVEYRLQLDGLATALNSARVQEVWFAQPEAPIRIAVYEWSGPPNQTLILPWTTLDTPTDLARASAVLRAHERLVAAPTTAIGSALLYGFRLLDEQESCWKRTLDLSGDGETNVGPRPQDIPDSRTPTGVIVNGLVVGSPVRTGGELRFDNVHELESYYESYVVRGPGAFVELALGFNAYAAAMERKLLRELASIAMAQVTVQP